MRKFSKLYHTFFREREVKRLIRGYGPEGGLALVWLMCENGADFLNTQGEIEIDVNDMARDIGTTPEKAVEILSAFSDLKGERFRVWWVSEKEGLLGTQWVSFKDTHRGVIKQSEAGKEGAEIRWRGKSREKEGDDSLPNEQPKGDANGEAYADKDKDKDINARARTTPMGSPSHAKMHATALYEDHIDALRFKFGTGKPAQEHAVFESFANLIADGKIKETNILPIIDHYNGKLVLPFFASHILETYTEMTQALAKTTPEPPRIDTGKPEWKRVGGGKGQKKVAENPSSDVLEGDDDIPF